MANILVPFDFSPNAIAALEQAFYIADGKGLNVEVLHILNFKAAHDYPKEWNIDPHHVDLGAIHTRLSELVFDKMEACCGGRNKLEVTTLVKESVMINGGIINHMLLERSDIIIMGTHGATNAMERFWGSNTATMINHALFPVMAVPPHWNPVRFKELIAAVNLKELATLASQIIKWADWLHAEAEVVTMTSLPSTDQEELDKAIQEYPGIKAHLVEKKNDLPMWKNLVQFTAERKEAALLMFVHERTVLEKLFNYSITSKVADGIRIPLLALPTKHK